MEPQIEGRTQRTRGALPVFNPYIREFLSAGKYGNASNVRMDGTGANPELNAAGCKRPEWTMAGRLK